MGLAEDGTILYDTKSIEDIEVGDLVYSYNTITGEYEYSEVTSTMALTSKHVCYLTIEDEQGNEQTIETTDAHPFWVVSEDPDLTRSAGEYVNENGVWLYHENMAPTDNGYWVEAKDLRVGDVFLGADGKLSTLTNKTRVEQDGGIAVFNFTVEGNHNYFVLAKDFGYGQSCVLVHNACWDDLLENSLLIKPAKRTNAAIYQRPGGISQAVDDFYSLKPENVKTYSNGAMSGILSDGTMIDIHMSSTTGLATLGIHTAPNPIKIRYN